MDRTEKTLKVIVVGAIVVAIVCLATRFLMPAKIAALAVGIGTLFYIAVAI